MIMTDDLIRPGLQQSTGPLMLDIGANAVLYTFYGAAVGYDVIAFQPQPGCLADIPVSPALNGADEYVTLVNAPVLEDRFEVFIPSIGCNTGLQAASLTTMEITTVTRLTTTIEERVVPSTL